MTITRKFALDGVSPNLQFGKDGLRLDANLNGLAFEARNPTNSALVHIKAAPGVAPDDVVVKSQLDGFNGFQIILGDVSSQGDGSWSPGAVPLTESTLVSEAVDRLNEVLFLLVPKQPVAFPNASLTVTGVGSSPRLAAGFTDNTGGVTGLVAGGIATRVTSASITTNTFNDTGPGDEGTVTLLLNGNNVGEVTLTGSGDNGTYGSGLVISDQKDFPTETPGFWKSVDIGVASLAVSVGLNRIAIQHSAAGATPDLPFVRDTMTTTPTLSAGLVTVFASGTLSYSSSVPHFGTDGVIAVGMAISNLAGQTYYGGTDPLTISGTNSIFTPQTFTYAEMGISTPIAANTTAPVAITPVQVPIDGNLHGSGLVQAVLRNVNGTMASTSVSATSVLVKRGVAASTRIDEMSIPVTGLGTTPNANNAQRLGGLAAGDNPSGSGSTFVPSGALAVHEAAVVGGILRHDVTNYSLGHVPAGPDFSTGRSGAQYFTLSFQRAAVSTFRITVTGTYAGCWVKLPGVSDNSAISPEGSAANGWWDATRLYDGIGVPGKTGDALRGCALGAVMSGSGTFTITFGTASSTDATGNTIMVRFRLNAGQSISSVSISN